MTLAQARQRLEAHASEFSDESVGEVPRLVLVATEFGLNITTTAVFLHRKLGIDIDLVQLRAYKTASGELVVSVSKIFPPPNMDDIVLWPNVEEELEKKLEKTREKNTVARLLAAEAIPDGTVLRLVPGNEMVAPARKQVSDYVVSHPEQGRATWKPSPNAPSAPLVWEADGKRYSPTGLVRHVASLAGVEITSIAGPRSWRDPKNLTLPDIAAKHPD